MVTGDYVKAMSVLIIAALKSEVKTLLDRWGVERKTTLGRHTVLYECLNDAHILRTGIGLNQATRVLEKFSTPDALPTKILHIGVSGALVDDFDIGQMVRGVTFTNEAGDRVSPELWRPDPITSQFPEGRFLSVIEAVKTTKASHQLNEKTQAQLVDMESHAVATFCRKNEVPLCAIRIVSDRADDRAMLTFIHEFRTQAKRLQAFVLENWEGFVSA